ncbi:MAG TPA: DUF2304 domain-containing protein [Candidatus Hydrogenedentes bacterium]|nr:DUF2304 domain-containing protein [Candidatus Hydrogenedentota bacterium]
MGGYEQVGIQLQHRFGILALSIMLVLLVLDLMRRGWLKERYALLWLTTAGLSLLVGLFPGLIVAAANLFHFQYLTVLFSMYFVFTLGLVMSFSIVISRLTDRNRELTQELALLAHTVERLEKNIERRA